MAGASDDGQLDISGDLAECRDDLIEGLLRNETAQREEIRAIRIEQRRVTVAIRPERIAVLSPGETAPDNGSVLDATIVDRSYLGSRWMYHLEIGPTLLRVETARELPLGPVQLHVPPGAALVFAGEEAPVE